METRLRMLLVLAGLPEPEINLKIRDEVISSGIFSTPEQTRCVHRILLARGLLGVPLRLGDAWRAHFPGHADAT